MKQVDVKNTDVLVKQWLKAIKEQILYDVSSLTVTTKKHERDLVTQKDKEVELYLRKKIMENYPDAQIISEESAKGYDEMKNDMVWIIDPIDGTTNFVKQHDEYCILIACFIEKQPLLSYIYNFQKDELLYAISKQGVYLNDRKLEPPKNVGLKDALISLDIRALSGTKLFDVLNETCFDFRYIGSSGLDAIKVFTGSFGAFLSPHIGGPWDYAPYFLIAKELGLHLCAWDTNPLQIHKVNGLILSTEQIFEEIKAYL